MPCRCLVLAALLIFCGCELVIGNPDPEGFEPGPDASADQFRFDVLCDGEQDSEQRQRQGTTLMISTTSASTDPIRVDIGIEGLIDVVLTSDAPMLWFLRPGPNTTIAQLLASGPNQQIISAPLPLNRIDLDIGTTVRWPREVGAPGAEVVIAAEQLIGPISMFVGCEELTDIAIDET